MMYDKNFINLVSPLIPADARILEYGCSSLYDTLARSDLDVTCAVDHKFSFDKNTFDIVVSNSLNDVKFLGECLRVVKKRGKVVVRDDSNKAELVPEMLEKLDILDYKLIHNKDKFTLIFYKV